MSKIEQWFRIDPLDTLFFRGGDPMDIGETHDTGMPLFPPMPGTVLGALRTAILMQRGVDLKRVAGLGDDEDLDGEKLPFWGTPAKSGFGITGPLLMAKDVLLFPAPANWFLEDRKGQGFRVFEARPVDPDGLPVKGKKRFLCWMENPPEDADPMSGNYWVTKKALEQRGEGVEFVEDLGELSGDKAQAVGRFLLFGFEPRVGIARDNTARTAKGGHLYSSSHVRLRHGVSLVVGVDKPICPSHLDPEGVFQLGGEGRLVRYKLLEPPPALPLSAKTGCLLVTPLSWTRAKKSGLLGCPYASGKLFRAGGWDLRKGFHKPAESYFPVGAVFFTEDNRGFTELIPF
ncbi:type III-B CRISPR module-associated Cmr3 family protein [Thermodesulforhabdus norvegica]|uniref:CRISPR-associated protein Cmr3 n=1 Tax=Thermodesulforhabdus norvegica TaxID=39841 RepID=A0A1I4TAE5_9BACT|nr:type III-B CRISPR module-associated Cmr3 family protein [Thermodesulforhabdus norvegica]SFM73704.1 CRISPR-associated protein Cmr3 [Thermodesulforhabdus norvegica]